MNYACLGYKSVLEPVLEPNRLQDLDEVRGNLYCIEETESGCLALIDKIAVLLPPELIDRLQNCVGQEIGILRANDRDYRIKILDDNAHA